MPGISGGRGPNPLFGFRFPEPGFPQSVQSERNASLVFTIFAAAESIRRAQRELETSQAHRSGARIARAFGSENESFARGNDGLQRQPQARQRHGPRAQFARASGSGNESFAQRQPQARQGRCGAQFPRASGTGNERFAQRQPQARQGRCGAQFPRASGTGNDSYAVRRKLEETGEAQGSGSGSQLAGPSGSGKHTSAYGRGQRQGQLKTPNQMAEQAKPKKQKKSSDHPRYCHLCGNRFESKGKLKNHIKQSGHFVEGAVALGGLEKKIKYAEKMAAEGKLSFGGPGGSDSDSEPEPTQD